MDLWLVSVSIHETQLFRIAIGIARTTMALDKKEVAALFDKLAQGEKDYFFDHVADDVDWTVMGRHPIAGRYTKKADFVAATCRIDNALERKILFKVQHILVDDNVAVIEMQSEAVAKNGETFNNAYCWVVTFADGKIRKVRAYVDSASVAKLLAENEWKMYTFLQ